MMYIPEKVHFGLGFGFKYQAMLVLLLDVLHKTTYFKTKKVSKLNKDIIKNVILKEGTFANRDKFISSLEKITKINDAKLLDTNKKIIVIEGEHHYLEDINIFFKNGVYDTIFFYQVKGNSQYKKNGTENISSVKTTVMKALYNFMENRNIQECKDIKFMILTNKDVPNYFFLNDENDKKQLVDYVVNTLQNIKHIQKYVTSINISTALITTITNLIFEDNKITRPRVLRIFLLHKKHKLSKKNKDIIWSQVDDNLIFKLENLRYIIQNLKVIGYLDHRLVYLFLQYFYSTSCLNNILMNIEIKAIDASEINVIDMHKELTQIGFLNASIQKIKFSEDNDKFKIGKIL